MLVHLEGAHMLARDLLATSQEQLSRTFSKSPMKRTMLRGRSLDSRPASATRQREGAVARWRSTLHRLPSSDRAPLGDVEHGAAQPGGDAKLPLDDLHDVVEPERANAAPSRVAPEQRHMARNFQKDGLSSFIPGPANLVPTPRALLGEDNRGIHSTIPR